MDVQIKPYPKIRVDHLHDHLHIFARQPPMDVQINPDPNTHIDHLQLFARHPMDVQINPSRDILVNHLHIFARHPPMDVQINPYPNIWVDHQSLFIRPRHMVIIYLCICIFMNTCIHIWNKHVLYICIYRSSKSTTSTILSEIRIHIFESTRIKTRIWNK